MSNSKTLKQKLIALKDLIGTIIELIWAILTIEPYPIFYSSIFLSILLSIYLKILNKTVIDLPLFLIYLFCLLVTFGILWLLSLIGRRCWENCYSFKEACWASKKDSHMLWDYGRISNWRKKGYYQKGMREHNIYWLYWRWILEGILITATLFIWPLVIKPIIKTIQRKSLST